MEIKTVSLIGLGALGILFGQQMAKNMSEDSFHIIANKNRIERYKKEGIYSNGEKCVFNYLEPGEQAPTADLLIFSVKFGGLEQAIEDARNQVGENTVILSLLNGISSEEVLAQAYGAEKVLYCVAQGMDATKTGNKLVYGNMGLLSFGERDGQKTERVLSIANFFDKVGIPYETPDNMMRKLWSKFMLNVGGNQTAMVYHTNYGGLQKPGEARDSMLRAMREVMRISQAVGINLTEEDIQYWMGVMDTLSPEGTPSMRQDADAKRKSEVELFSGTVTRLGKKYGIPTPVNDEYYAKIKEIEENYPDQK